MNRFPSEPWENRPSNDELDERDAALEAKGDIERDDRGFEVTESVMEELLLDPNL
jgi:hypothetical protein